MLIDRNKRIIAGHGRVLAATDLGMTEVPTMQLEHLSDTEVRALILADNQLATRAGWDRELVALELQGLLDLDFEIEVIGFEPGEIDLRLGASWPRQWDPMPAALRMPSRPLRPGPCPGRATSGSWVATGCCAATRSAPTATAS